MIVRRIAGFLDERFGSNAALRYFAVKIYPDHWSFYLGEFALYTFMLLVLTGVWLTFVYDATPNGAFASVVALSRIAPVGYLMRQIHHWSAVTFVAAILVHMARIFFTAAFRKPRELNWVVGVTLLLLASLTGLTGYSLPNDALSGTGLRITNSVALSIPIIGRWMADVLNGGAYPGPALLSHLYTFHVYFLPVTIALLLSVHLGMIIYQKHTQFVPDPAHVVGRRFWLDYALRSASAFAVTAGIILLLASLVEINPIEKYGAYQYWIVPNPAVPDWYAAFLEGALRIGPAVEFQIFGHPVPAIFWPGVVFPLCLVILVISWPWIDAYFTRDTAKHDILAPASSAPWRVGAGVAILFAGFVLTLAAGDDQQALALHAPLPSMVIFYRLAFLFGPIVAGLLAAALARGIAARRADRATQAEREVVLRRNAAGGFEEEEPQSA